MAILGTSAVLVHKGVTRRSNAEQDKKGSLGPLSSYEGLPGFEAKLRSDFAALVGDVYVESSIVAGPGAPPKELKSGSGGPYFSGLSRVDILVFNFGDGDQVGGTIAGTDQILLSDRVVEKCSKAKNYDSRACVLVYQFVIAEYLHTAQGGAHVDADEDIDDITQQLVRQTPWGPPEPGGLHGK